MPDATALYSTLDKVIAADAAGLWDQVRWVGPMNRDNQPAPECGTAGCFAGHRAFMDGFHYYGEYYRTYYQHVTTPSMVLVNKATDEEILAGICGCEDCTPQMYKNQGYVFMPRHFTTIDLWAAERLRLDDEDAERLFAETNSLTDLKEIVDDILVRAANPETAEQVMAEQARLRSVALQFVRND